MCFGPRDIGPNALVNNTNDVRTHSIVEAGKRKDEQQTENNNSGLRRVKDFSSKTAQRGKEQTNSYKLHAT